ncbi:hypothetical protein BFP72_10855 [Reichenbachiella sp. 5M10]|uniref:PepSY-like domain-containing protein n=1 Tax=Reichenbachiella sp. 5M10 TaxID=1889772 RepID=UPI000C159115|nr:PepSY-like domain-containing protein [Reichenbachiella sp. 5M10]PIB35857.1 hypothetical protein BFP72_10855 [Reichenbachiella sp. 5M10]
MNKHLALLIIGLLVAWSPTLAQDIPQNRVPSVIVNRFKQDFPKAYDIEWKVKNNQYNVEFETGIFTDHEIWYDTTGEIIRHEEEISHNELPSPVTAKLDRDFNGFRIDDAKRITTSSTVDYSVELNSFTQEWKIIFDKNGEISTQIAD